MDEFERRSPYSARPRRPIKVTVTELPAGKVPGLDTYVCRKCGPCYEDAAVGREWCAKCLARGCGMRKRAWEKLRRWFGAGDEKKK